MTTFEQGFADTERAAAAALQAAAGVVSAAKQMQRAAADGDIAKIRRASERLGAAVDAARQEAANAKVAWPFSQGEEEAFLKDGYEGELLDAARVGGLQIHQQDQRLVAFPSVIRILPTERAVRIDRKKVPTIRPSKLVALLKSNQTKRPRFASERFLEAIYRAYRLLTGKDGMGTTVKLSSIYEAFTLLPGVSSDYDQADFGRDMLLLDRSGLKKTRSGAKFSLPASTGTKGGQGAFAFVAPDGETVTFYGIRFTEGA